MGLWHVVVRSGRGQKRGIGRLQPKRHVARGSSISAMTSELRNLVNGVLSDKMLLNHPFYRRWETGKLEAGELTSYAEQYRHFEAMFPAFLRRLAESLPEGIARTNVEMNLADETGEPSHLDLFESFAAHYGAASVQPSAKMIALMAAYESVLTAGPNTALAGLLAYEAQGDAIARTKAEGLRDFYGATDEAMRFWLEHSEIEGDHSTWTYEALVAQEATQDEIVVGLNTVARAWWEFLDERESLAQVA